MTWAPDYVTLAAQKTYMRITDSVDDAELAINITAASRAIDDACNRQFGKVAAPEARVYTARYDYRRCVWVVDIDDLQNVTGLAITVKGTALTAYTLEPVNAVLEGKAWTRLVIDPALSSVVPTGADNEISATAPWGWTAFPVSVVNACKLQTKRFASRRVWPVGVAGSPEQGTELRLLSRLDPDVAVSLRGYRRRRKVG